MKKTEKAVRGILNDPAIGFLAKKMIPGLGTTLDVLDRIEKDAKKRKVKSMSERIPFNTWSRKRIMQGRKFCTSRSRRWNDPRVIGVIFLSWGVIKKTLWQAEGADSPEELQKVVNQIFRREVQDNEWFYVHFGDFRDAEQKGVQDGK